MPRPQLPETHSPRITPRRWHKLLTIPLLLATMWSSITLRRKAVTKPHKMYNFVSYWLIMALAGFFIFCGMMHLTEGLHDEIMRYVLSAVVSLLTLEKIFSRLK